MIIVKIQGGLGNQMFQYAIGQVLAKINDTPLVIDNSALSNPGDGQIVRKYLLNGFHIEENIATKKLLDSIKYGSLLYNFKIKKLVHIKQLVFDEEAPKRSNFRNAELIVKPDPTSYFGDILSKFNADVYLDGYWQSYKNYKGFENLIKEQFRFKDEVLQFDQKDLDAIDNTQSVSIHFRLKDRVTSDFDLKYFRQLDFDYYMDSINLIKEKVSKPHFFIFSDNVEWCKENFKLDHPTTYVNAKSEYDDMFLMGRCKHHILSHSTFCWWAAWLNYNKEKVVIAPEKWFNYQTDKLEDLLLDEWIKI